MGADFSAYTILGLRVDYNWLKDAYIKRNTRVARGCDHDVPEGQKFCGQCGAEREVTLVPCFGSGDFEMDLSAKIKGASAITDDCENPKFMYFGFLSRGSEYQQAARFDVPDPQRIEELKAALRDMFIPLGCWDPRNFGVWTMLYCSY